MNLLFALVLIVSTTVGPDILGSAATIDETAVITRDLSLSQCLAQIDAAPTVLYQAPEGMLVHLACYRQGG